MECKFVAGQQVICKLTGPCWFDLGTGLPINGPKEGEIFTISSIELGFEDIISLRFMEYPVDLWDHKEFIPLSEKPEETSIEEIKKLLTPTKVLENV